MRFRACFSYGRQTRVVTDVRASSPEAALADVQASYGPDCETHYAFQL